jgi:NADH dehydrogenase
MKRSSSSEGGFAGINAAKGLGGVRDIEVTLIDQRNHHLFQPLRYQVAMARPQSADIAAPIRAPALPLFEYSRASRECGISGPQRKNRDADIGTFPFQTTSSLPVARRILWPRQLGREFTPGLKTLRTGNRNPARQVLTAFEMPNGRRFQGCDAGFPDVVIVVGGPCRS